MLYLIEEWAQGRWWPVAKLLNRELASQWLAGTPNSRMRMVS